MTEFGCVSNILQLPSDFADFILEASGGPASPPLITFCRRQLMHECWSKLLDDDFCHAYAHGTLIKFTDGLTCHVYPCIFTYSADYPEK